jgi:hypothetical protein
MTDDEITWEEAMVRPKVKTYRRFHDKDETCFRYSPTEDMDRCISLRHPDQAYQFLLLLVEAGYTKEER